MNRMWKLKTMVTSKIKATQKRTQADKEKLKEKAEEDTMVLATRFLAFDEGCLLMMQYLHNRPIRDYCEFNLHPADTSRPIPSVQWDSQVTNAYRINNLREIHLLNYKLIQGLPDAEENLCTILLIFAEVNYDHVSVVKNDVI